MAESVLNARQPARPQPIPGFLADLEHRLRGRARWRRDVLAEVEDGLLCAAADHERAGLDPLDAQAIAVAQWGDVEHIAAAYNRNSTQLTARQLNRYSLLITPVLAIGWTGAMLGSPAGPWPREPWSVSLGLSLMVSGGLLALIGGTLSERAARDVRSVRGPGLRVIGSALAAGHGLLFAIIASMAMLAHRGIPHPHSLSWPLVALPAVLSLGTAARLTALMRRLRGVPDLTRRWHRLSGTT